MQCPGNSFVYNTTQCACNPGFLYSPLTRSCLLFSESDSVESGSGVDYSLAYFPATIFDFNAIKKFTQSQAVFLEVTLVLLLTWLFFCFGLRLVGPLRDGSSPWFKIRWWVSRLDVCFATRHWLDDQKPVMKRKTELGGTLSVASWILFLGLFSALLYQIISKRSLEVHTVRATNSPDLESFRNDLEFNVTTISSMTCSNLSGLGTLVIGNPGSIDYRTSPLSSFVNYSCLNTTRGPMITLKCNKCQLLRDIAYVSWHFVDLPNSPATAVGFQYNITASNPADKKHLSHVGGTSKNGGNIDRKPVTFRGPKSNILKFNLFPRHYHTMHDLKLIQPLFDEFLPGTSFGEFRQLKASMQNTNDGLVNITLYVNFLTSYIFDVNNANVLGPVSFLANLGGLYCFSICIFFFLLVQCEYRIKKLRHEDAVVRRIRSQRKAQQGWDKLRKYVAYTWGSSSLSDDQNNVEKDDACCCCAKSFHKSRSSSVKHKKQTEPATINFSKKDRVPSKQKYIPMSSLAQVSMQSSFPPVSGLEERPSHSTNDSEATHELPCVSSLGIYSKRKAFSMTDDLTIPPPPSLGSKALVDMNLTDLKQGLQNLYDYNAILSEKLVAAQSVIHYLSKNPPSTSSVVHRDE